jgi:hypothetical protein
VFFTITLTAGSSTVFGDGDWIFGLPVPTKRYIVASTVYVNYSSLNSPLYNGIAFVNPTNSGNTSIRPYFSSTQINYTNPFNWYTNDTLVISGTYETS